MFPASQQSLPKCKKSRRVVKEERELKMTVAGLDLSYGAGVRTLRRMDGARSTAARPPTRVHVVRLLVPCTPAMHVSATVSKIQHVGGSM